MPPPLLWIKSLQTRYLLKQRRVPLRQFSALWDRTFSTENFFIPFVCLNFFDTLTFLKQWKVPPRTFSVLWDKKSFNRKKWIPPPKHKVFGNPKLSETLKSSHTKFVGTVIQNIFDGKLWYPSSLSLIQNFNYHTKKIADYRRDHLRNISVLWDKRLPTKNCDFRIFCTKFVETRVFLGNRRIPPPRFRCGLVGLNFFWRKPWCPLSTMHETFWYGIFLKHRRVPLRSFFGTVRRKVSERKSW